MTKDEALKLALEALEPFSTPNWAGAGVDKANEATTAIKEALALPAQEPVAYLTKRKIGGTEGLLRANMVDKSAKNQETHDFIPPYTTPPQRTRVGLTDEERASFEATLPKTQEEWDKLFNAIEAKLK